MLKLFIFGWAYIRVKNPCARTSRQKRGWAFIQDGLIFARVWYKQMFLNQHVFRAKFESPITCVAKVCSQCVCVDTLHYFPGVCECVWYIAYRSWVRGGMVPHWPQATSQWHHYSRAPREVLQKPSKLLKNNLHVIDLPLSLGIGNSGCQTQGPGATHWCLLCCRGSPRCKEHTHTHCSTAHLAWLTLLFRCEVVIVH